MALLFFGQIVSQKVVEIKQNKHTKGHRRQESIFKWSVRYQKIKTEQI